MTVGASSKVNYQGHRNDDPAWAKKLVGNLGDNSRGVGKAFKSGTGNLTPGGIVAGCKKKEEPTVGKGTEVVKASDWDLSPTEQEAMEGLLQKVYQEAAANTEKKLFGFYSTTHNALINEDQEGITPLKTPIKTVGALFFVFRHGPEAERLKSEIGNLLESKTVSWNDGIEEKTLRITEFKVEANPGGGSMTGPPQTILNVIPLEVEITTRR